MLSSPDFTATMDIAPNGIVNTTKQGGVVSIYYLGTLVGCFWGGSISDKYGRKSGTFFGTFWCIVGAALQSAAQNANWFLCARLIAGVGTGYLITIVPAWSAELARSHSRGASICRLFLFNYSGITVAYWLAFGVSFVDGGQGSFRWRFPIAFMTIPALILCCTIHFFPESPRWLIKSGRNEEALEIFRKIREDRANVNVEAEIAAEYEEIVRLVDQDKEHLTRNSLWAMPFGYKSGKLHYGRRVALAFGIQIMMEWGGITAVVIYGPIVFSQAGYDAVKVGWLSALNNTCGILGTYICSLIIDRLGRRKMLYVGSLGCSVSMFLAGAFAKLVVDHPENAQGYGAGSIVFLFFFTMFFSSTWLMVTWIYPTEIWPTEIRSRGNSFAVAGFAIGCAWTTLVNPIMFGNITYNTFWIFGIVNLLYIPIVWAFYPETTKRSLESIQFLFASSSPLVWSAEKEYKQLSDSHGGRLTLHDVLDDVEANGKEKPRQANGEPVN